MLKNFCDNLPDVDTSIFSLEKVKKIVDEYNEALSIKEEPVVPVSQPVVEETPDNLQELMEFAALMNFEPEPQPVSRPEPEDEEDEDEDDDNMFERIIAEGTVDHSGQGLISQITSQEELGNISPNVLQQMIGVDPATNNVVMTNARGDLGVTFQDYPATLLRNSVTREDIMQSIQTIIDNSNEQLI